MCTLVRFCSALCVFAQDLGVCVYVCKSGKSEHHAVPGFQNIICQRGDSSIQAEDESVGAASGSRQI